jgi:uncharacterized membrane protein YhiD involved in acid resistance
VFLKMIHPGEVISALVSAAFIAVVMAPFWALSRWLSRRREARVKQKQEAASAQYADEFKRKERQLEESLHRNKGAI